MFFLDVSIEQVIGFVLLDVEHRFMNPQTGIGDARLSGEENKLAELERQKGIIETEEHRGFGDAIRLIQLSY